MIWIEAVDLRYFLMKRVLVREGPIAVRCRGRAYMLKPETYRAIVNVLL
jgi:hypothetical protein